MQSNNSIHRRSTCAPDIVPLLLRVPLHMSWPLLAKNVSVPFIFCSAVLLLVAMLAIRALKCRGVPYAVWLLG